MSLLSPSFSPPFVSLFQKTHQEEAKVQVASVVDVAIGVLRNNGRAQTLQLVGNVEEEQHAQVDTSGVGDAPSLF